MGSIPLLGNMRDSSALHMQNHPPDAKTPSRDRNTLQRQKDPPATGESEVSSNREIAKTIVTRGNLWKSLGSQSSKNIKNLSALLY